MADEGPPVLEDPESSRALQLAAERLYHAAGVLDFQIVNLTDRAEQPRSIAS